MQTLCSDFVRDILSLNSADLVRDILSLNSAKSVGRIVRCLAPILKVGSSFLYTDQRVEW